MPRHPPCALSCLTWLSISTLLEDIALSSIRTKKWFSFVFFLIRSFLNSRSWNFRRLIFRLTFTSFLFLEKKLDVFSIKYLSVFGFQGANSLYSEWAWEDSNFRPHAYQACALTGWATSPYSIDMDFIQMETERFELLTPCLQGRCSPNWATPPLFSFSGSVIRLFSFFIIWRPPTLPYRLQHSTIGRLSLNHRVRDGNGCFP